MAKQTPDGTPTKATKVVIIGCIAAVLLPVIIFVVLTGIVCIGSLTDKESRQAAKDHWQRSRVITAAHDYVKQYLKCPGTAKFDPYYGEEIRGTSDKLHIYVLGWVDAQNEFGALIRSEYVVEMKRATSDQEWQLVEIALDPGP